MSLKLMGRKKGMARLFDDKGNLIVCTVISAEPNVVAQVKTKATDGYESIQLASQKVTEPKKRNVSKPLQGHYKKGGIEPRKFLMESRVEKAEDYKAGQEVSVGYFNDCAFVDVAGVSKGKGHQGVIKRHNFAGGPAAHGSGFHRHGGSCGMRSSPGRCLPGQKKSGRMGGDAVTTQNLEIVKIDEENNLLVVRGAIPGARGGLVVITKAVKKSSSQNKAKK